MAEFTWTDEQVEKFAGLFLYSYVGYDLSNEFRNNCKDVLAAFKKVNSEWEVVAYDTTLLLDENIPADKYAIKIVRRVSDGEIFSVGDVVMLNDNTWVIERIFKNYRERKGLGYSNDLVLGDIANAQILKKGKQPQFKTEDGVDIYADSSTDFWVVFSDFSYGPYDLKTMGNDFMLKMWEVDINRRSFSTKDAAKEYVNMNKPVFSRKQVIEQFSKNGFIEL